MTKLLELAVEALPGLTLQLVAFIKNGSENTTSAYVSIFLSTASAAMTVTAFFFDLDVDPSERKKLPHM